MAASDQTPYLIYCLPSAGRPQMMARKPRMLVTVAQANKTARIVWALMSKDQVYKAPVAAAA